jgi:hypothetical protein
MILSEVNAFGKTVTQRIISTQLERGAFSRQVDDA